MNISHKNINNAISITFSFEEMCLDLQLEENVWIIMMIMIPAGDIDGIEGEDDGFDNDNNDEFW